MLYQKLRLFVGKIFDSPGKEKQVALAKEEITSLTAESEKLIYILNSHIALQNFITMNVFILNNIY